MTAKTISIINLKGGVGKSTLTMILAEFLAFRFSKDVLLIDMDAQANLSYCMVPDHEIRNQERRHRTAYHLLREGFESRALDIVDYITQPPLVVSNIARSGMSRHDANLHMVISTPSVAQLDDDLLKLWENNKPWPRDLRQTLRRALEPALNRYDYILIDCPPGLSIFSSTALIASDYYISPIIPEPLSLQGVRLIKDRQADLRDQHGGKASFAGVILNIVKHYRNTHSDVSRNLFTSGLNEYQPFTNWLPDNERLRRLGEFNPDLDGDWAGGYDSKFTGLYQKYGLSYFLTNPKAGPLNLQDSEGLRYRLQDRMSHLTEEFMERCKT